MYAMRHAQASAPRVQYASNGTHPRIYDKARLRSAHRKTSAAVNCGLLGEVQRRADYTCRRALDRRMLGPYNATGKLKGVAARVARIGGADA